MYLDFAATSKISQIWIDSIIDSNSKGLFGNPGSYHKAGFDALDMMENSTINILNNIFDNKEIAKKYDICYNSGSTESINQFMYAMSKQSNTLVVYENVAHKAVLKSVQKYFPNDYFELDFSLSVEDNMENLRNTLENVKEEGKKYYKRCLLVLTSVNNETGGIFSPRVINEVNEIFKEYKEVSTYFGERVIDVFLDHTQGFMKHNQHLELADAFCFSAHKIGGMKGFGGLVYLKDEYERILKENPLIVGGYEIRGGTKDPISVKALENLVKYKNNNYGISLGKVSFLHSYIIDKINEIAKECKVPLTFNQRSDFFGDQSNYIINASFIGIEGESLMSSLIDDCISTGSACNSSELKTSHVLSGMGIKKLYANCAFRISIDENVDKDELDDFLDNRFKPAVKFLARMRTRHGEE